MDNRKANRLAKMAEKDAKKAIRNARKRELRALQKVDLAATEAEKLQTQVAELTAAIETGRRDAAREAELMAEQLSEAEKELRRLQERSRSVDKKHGTTVGFLPSVRC